MSLREITDPDFAPALQTSPQPVLVYFWAAWCGPCRLMAPTIKAIADTYGDQLTVLKLEVDASPSAVAACKVEGVPALRLFKDQQLVASHEGAIAKPKLLSWLHSELPFVETP